jgi:hypothetical protein
MISIIYKGITFNEPIQPKDDHSKYHGRTSYHTLNGSLKRQPCEICGDIKTHGHHEDYENGKIRWLCCQHHFILHRLFTKARNIITIQDKMKLNPDSEFLNLFVDDFKTFANKYSLMNIKIINHEN